MSRRTAAPAPTTPLAAVVLTPEATALAAALPLQALRDLLDFHPQARTALKHLATVEQSLAFSPATGLQLVPAETLRRAHMQLSEVMASPLGARLAQTLRPLHLRLHLAVLDAVIAETEALTKRQFADTTIENDTFEDTTPLGLR